MEAILGYLLLYTAVQECQAILTFIPDPPTIKEVAVNNDVTLSWFKSTYEEKNSVLLVKHNGRTIIREDYGKLAPGQSIKLLHKNKTIRFGLPSSKRITFTFEAVTRQDGGIYTCQDEADISGNLRNVALVVRAPPAKPFLQVRRVHSSNSSVLSCVSSCTTIPANYCKRIMPTWYTDNDDVIKRNHTHLPGIVELESHELLVDTQKAPKHTTVSCSVHEVGLNLSSSSEIITIERIVAQDINALYVESYNWQSFEIPTCNNNVVISNVTVTHDVVGSFSVPKQPEMFKFNLSMTDSFIGLKTDNLPQAVTVVFSHVPHDLAGPFSFEFNGEIGNLVCTINATLVVIDKPNVSIISQTSTNHHTGAVTRLSCRSALNISPKQYTRPLVYNWTINGLALQKDVRFNESSNRAYNINGYNIQTANNSDLLITAGQNEDRDSLTVGCGVEVHGFPRSFRYAVVHIDASPSKVNVVVVTLASIVGILTFLGIVIFIIYCVWRKLRTNRKSRTSKQEPEAEVNTNENEYNVDFDDYAFINASRMYSDLPCVTPRLPKRDSTYAQAFEDTRIPDDVTANNADIQTNNRESHGYLSPCDVRGKVDRLETSLSGSFQKQ